MPVILVSKRQRADGSYEVTLSQDGVRFNAVVTKDVAEGSDALNVYQVMANQQCKTKARLDQIAEEGRRF